MYKKVIHSPQLWSSKLHGQRLLSNQSLCVTNCTWGLIGGNCQKSKAEAKGRWGQARWFSQLFCDGSDPVVRGSQMRKLMPKITQQGSGICVITEDV